MNYDKHFIAMSWNIEGIKRNVYSLCHFVSLHHPDLVFLSESQIFSCDSLKVMEFLKKDYCFVSNSEDNHQPEAPLIKPRASGGTLIMWKRSLDPYIEVQPLSTTSTLPIIFQPPGCSPSIHICIYLPTAGQDSQFIEELAKLSSILCHLRTTAPNAPIFLRGDFNVNNRNKKRVQIYNSFLIAESLTEITIKHRTYHHFTGDGASDSNLDKILVSHGRETLHSVLCGFDDPLISSHHDIILSQF